MAASLWNFQHILVQTEVCLLHPSKHPEERRNTNILLIQESWTTCREMVAYRYDKLLKNIISIMHEKRMNHYARVNKEHRILPNLARHDSIFGVSFFNLRIFKMHHWLNNFIFLGLIMNAKNLRSHVIKSQGTQVQKKSFELVLTSYLSQLDTTMHAISELSFKCKTSCCSRTKFEMGEAHIKLVLISINKIFLNYSELNEKFHKDFLILASPFMCTLI